MNYKELLKILQKNPNEIFLDAQGYKPFEGGILLVEKHWRYFGYFQNYGTHIWFFRTPEDFVDFLPALFKAHFLEFNAKFNLQFDVFKILCFDIQKIKSIIQK